MYKNISGPLAQLARAPALQAGGQGFESLRVHTKKEKAENIIVSAFLF